MKSVGVRLMFSKTKDSFCVQKRLEIGVRCLFVCEVKDLVAASMNLFVSSRDSFKNSKDILIILDPTNVIHINKWVKDITLSFDPPVTFFAWFLLV